MKISTMRPVISQCVNLNDTATVPGHGHDPDVLRERVMTGTLMNFPKKNDGRHIYFRKYYCYVLCRTS